MECLKGLKIKEKGENKTISYDENVMIGIYNSSNPFKISDIKSALKVVNEQAASYLMPIFVSAIGVLALLGMKMNNNSEHVTKPLIEIADTTLIEEEDTDEDILYENFGTNIFKPVKK